MSGTPEDLRGRRTLVAEDEYGTAYELAEALAEMEAIVVGPVSRVGEALAIAQSSSPLDGAVLNVNLAGETIWPVADALAARGVPMVLASGYDVSAIPPRHAGLPRCQKPAEPHTIIRVLARSIGRWTAAGS